MRRSQREAIMRQGVTLPDTPRERRQLSGLAADLEDNPVAGQPLPLRLRNFRPSAEGYLASLAGPLAYMVRLRRIDRLTEEHEVELGVAWRELAVECDGNAAQFARRWREAAETWSFEEVNGLIERHNCWYPVESRLRMDPSTGDYALVNGADYRRDPLDHHWVLGRFPPVLERVAAAMRPGTHAHEH